MMSFTTDRQTLEDLNIFGKQGRDSICSIFNRCMTRGGAAILEEMFRYPLSDAEAINRRSRIIQHFAERGSVFPFSSADFDSIGIYLSNTDERTKLSAQEHSVGKQLGNMIARDAETQVIHKGIAALTGLLRDLSGFLGTLELSEDDGYYWDAAAISALLAEPVFLPVLGHGKAKLTAAMLADFDVIFRFRNRDAVQKLLRHIYFLDVYLSVARVALERGFIFPKAMPKDNNELILEGVYHPQVENAVANSIRITPSGNVIFLTGANMAGKSTFMKTLSICLFLAHMGFPVAAARMEFSVLDGIYTTINLPDNLGMGASHFYAEVLRVKKMALELARGKKLFVLFDELFRGTNVKDAYEATVAITGAFALKRSSIFVISTHIIEAGAVLGKTHENVRFLYLPTKMEETTPVYTYRLEEGITEDRHGMVIINNEDIIGILERGMNRFNNSTIA
jgi:DNA mismatch repair ATPase MutS